MCVYLYMGLQCRFRDIVRGERMRGLGVKMDTTWLFVCPIYLCLVRNKE